MELEEALSVLGALVDAGRHPEADEAYRVVLARLDTIERRVQQIRGGLKPYARPVEVVDYVMGEQT